jgi:lipoate-protein ligase A
LVLGSTQPYSLVDGERATRAGVEVTRRRSGGGAVLVVPDDPLWVDVWVPTGDPLFDVDVGRAFLWLGRTWAEALSRTGVSGLVVAPRPTSGRTRTSACACACFGAVSSGEVMIDDGRKIVGLAQRRVRAGAWFHGACLGTWDPGALVALLSLSPVDARDAVDELTQVAVGLLDVLGEADVSVLGGAAASFLDALP